MLKPFGDEIWVSDGDKVSVAGFHYSTRMAVMRLTDGKLFIWSPIALSPELREAVDALGLVGFIVAPNSLHHLYLADWKAAYPDAKVIAAPGLAHKRKDIAFDAVLGEGAPSDWSGDIEQVLIKGNMITDEVVFFHSKSGTVLFADLIQNFPPDWFTGWRAIIARLDLMVAPKPTVPRKFRLAFTDRKAARNSIKSVLDWPVEKLIFAHGKPVEKNGHAAVAHAFRWLIK